MKKLIIFDCDGVLVDSEIIANRIESEMLTSYGYPISIEDSIKRFTGMSTKSVHKIIFEESAITLPSTFSDLVNEALINAFKKELKPLMLPVLSSDLLKNTDICVASSSPKKRVLMSLHVTGQNRFFKEKCVLTSEQVKNGKPAPDLFLFAAQQMGYNHRDCLVIEDSVAGISAARSANMTVIGFLGGSHTRFDWYKENIKNQDVPMAQDSLELGPMISAFIEEL